MKTIDMRGKPCPIPVIEAKKLLAQSDTEALTILVDNVVAVQNLEKMAGGYALAFSFVEHAKDFYEVLVSKSEDSLPLPLSGTASAATSATLAPTATATSTADAAAAAVATQGSSALSAASASSEGVTVIIGKDTMGMGAEELGKILIKGFIYSLSELPCAPKHLIFFNSGVHLAAEGANTLDDLKKLSEKGTEILSCGTCLNFYELQDKLAIGTVTDMYGITQRITTARSVISV